MKLAVTMKLALTSGMLILSQSLFASDLAEIYELAVQNDPQLAAAQASYMASKESIPQARAGLLPTLNLSGSTSDNRIVRETSLGDTKDEYNSQRWQAVLRQPLFRLDTWFQFKQAQNIESQAMAQLASEQQELIFRVANSYLTILQANDQLVSANAERDAVKRQLEQVQQRFDVGLVAITDVLESTAAFDNSTVNVIEAEGAQVVSFETLLRLTNQRFGKLNSLAGDFPVEYPEPNDEEAWVKRALESNYSLLASKQGVKAAHRNLHAAKSRHLPTLDAEFTYGESNSGQPISTRDANNQPVILKDVQNKQKVASLVLNVPVFSGFATRSGAKQAGYQLEQAQKNFDFTQRSVVENTRNLFSAINTDVARVRARLRGIESSQSALDATQTGYEVGTRNIVDVLLAQQRLFQAQFQYASARYRYILDTLKLKQAVGSLAPTDIYDLNKFMTASKTVDRITPTTR